MKTTIKIYENLKVGFQNRDGTYSGKLAYITYYADAKAKEKGVYSKQKSWDGWCHKKITPLECENKPLSGFVLNKKAGGTKYSWNNRNTYCRVYDPRGFEIEITIENLLYILHYCDCTRGKGLDGEFVYGWDGAQLLLIPTISEDYQEILEYNRKLNSKEFVDKSEIKPGTVFKTKDGQCHIYIGKFDTTESELMKFDSNKKLSDTKNSRNMWHRSVVHCMSDYFGTDVTNVESGQKHLISSYWINETSGTRYSNYPGFKTAIPPVLEIVKEDHEALQNILKSNSKLVQINHDKTVIKKETKMEKSELVSILKQIVANIIKVSGFQALDILKVKIAGANLTFNFESDYNANCRVLTFQYKNTVLCEKRIEHQEFYTKYRSNSKETTELVNFMLDEIENTLPDAKWVEYIKQSTNETIGFNIK